VHDDVAIRKDDLTLKELAARDQPASRAAAALIEVGFAETTRLDDLSPGSLIETLVGILARELEDVHKRLGEIYESAFIETETSKSLESLAEELCRRGRRPWPP
jgi:hypothetical protein